MNHVERFRALMDFKPVDRLPRIEWAGFWDQTLTRWKQEGLPAEPNGSYRIRKYLGLDPYYQMWLPPRSESYPKPPSHGRGNVEDMDDYQRIRPHLYPPNEEIIESMCPWGQAQRHGEVVVWITLEGFFWFPRTLLGIERHLYAFYDQAELLHRINADLAEHHILLLRKLAKTCRPTFMTFAEDMSYNHGPMLSRRLFDEFLSPYYRRVIPLLEEMGVLVLVDTDGDPSEMVTWLESVGIRGVLPLERQAGVDAGELRGRHRSWRMIGHFDKMVMPRGEQAMREEFERLLPVMKSGGFIPSVDHQTPPGVSLEKYRIYLRLLEEYSRLGGG